MIDKVYVKEVLEEKPNDGLVDVKFKGKYYGKMYIFKTKLKGDAWEKGKKKGFIMMEIKGSIYSSL